ncbi:MAG: DUF1232 domain-containing protein [Proteobacteria bacterium]|nr:DUF1232 domain-containing protein [Pseudomonadota bacterium]
MQKNSLNKIGIWKRLIEDFGLLYSLTKDYWKGNYREVPLWTVTLFALTIAYVVFPVDIIPDFIPGLGQLDDAVVILLCIYFIEKDLYRYKEWKMRNT